MESKIRTVAKINNIEIIMIENGGKLVPIRPICEALGIDTDSQRKKLKEDSILNSTTVLSTAVGGDGKDREMVCLPHMFIFGWLFTINPKNVKPEAREAVLRYKLECYKALYNTFAEQSKFLEQKQEVMAQKIEEMEKIRADFKEAKSRLDKAKKDLDEVKSLTFEQWKENNQQLSLIFPEEEIE